MPICVQPAGAVIAALFLVVTCATSTLPLATPVGRVITRDAAPPVPVTTVQPAKVPAPGPQAPTIAIGSITYGAGRVRSFRRSPSRHEPPLRASDQRAPSGVMFFPRRSRISTGRILTMFVPFDRYSTEPSTLKRGSRLSRPSSFQLQVRVPTRRSTTSDCSSVVEPSVTTSWPNRVVRAYPFVNGAQRPLPVPSALRVRSPSGVPSRGPAWVTPRLTLIGRGRAAGPSFAGAPSALAR